MEGLGLLVLMSIIFALFECLNRCSKYAKLSDWVSLLILKAGEYIFFVTALVIAFLLVKNF